MNNFPSTNNPTETTDERFIRLLNDLSQSPNALSTNENTTCEDLRALDELLTGDYITAGDSVREGGQVCVIVCMRINPQGRTYLAELQQKAGANTSVGFIKEHRFSFYKWFFGIVAAIIVGYFVWYMTH